MTPPTIVTDHRVDPWPNALRCRPCLCGHDGMDHSQILLDAPCLDCDCVMFLHRHLAIERPNPSRLST